jgi:hypothetical protein
MKRLLAFACALPIAVAATGARADSKGTLLATTVQLVQVRADGKFLVNFAHVTGDSAHRPKCAGASNLDTMSGDATTPGGKAMLDAILVAYSGKKKVNAYGAGKCSEFPTVTPDTPNGGYESLDMISLE